MIRGTSSTRSRCSSTRARGLLDALEELIGKAECWCRDSDCTTGLATRRGGLQRVDGQDLRRRSLDPSMKEYKEVSSASNAHDYQARRGRSASSARARRRPEYLHTLNASGLATSRLLPAIVEQFQEEDGSVSVPGVLREWVGKDRLEPVR